MSKPRRTYAPRVLSLSGKLSVVRQAQLDVEQAERTLALVTERAQTAESTGDKTGVWIGQRELREAPGTLAARQARLAAVVVQFGTLDELQARWDATPDTREYPER